MWTSATVQTRYIQTRYKVEQHRKNIRTVHFVADVKPMSFQHLDEVGDYMDVKERLENFNSAFI